jgi:hypothetical protein
VTRSWTTSELAWLKAQAGRLTKAALAAALGRSEAAVAMMAARMGVSLLCPRVWCPRCAQWRTSLGKGGTCRACALDMAAEREAASQAAAVAKALGARLEAASAAEEDAAARKAAATRLSTARQARRRSRT